MGIVDLVDKSRVISLDSNIFIRALDDPDTQGESARRLLERIKEEIPTIFISVIVLEEFFVRVYKDRREKETSRFLDFITMGGLATVINIDRDIALLAAKIRALHNVKAPDAIHLASAIAAGASVFFSFDKRLPRKIKKLTIRVP